MRRPTDVSSPTMIGALVNLVRSIDRPGPTIWTASPVVLSQRNGV
jgi:hypothetical protein